MQQTNTIYQTDPKWAQDIFTDLAKRYCQYTDADLKKELKEISTFDYSTYSGNIMAIATCLAYSLCQIDIQETKPDQDEGLNPEPRDVLVTEFLGTQLLVELVQPQYERSEAQRELEALVTETGGVYLVVYDFADFFHQFGDAFTNHGTSSST